jgi:hypothetical protein
MKDGLYVVKPWKLLEEQYGLNENQNINCRITWTKRMEGELNDYGRVIKVTNNQWNLWGISEDMLLGPYIPYGTEVEVSDYGEEWSRKTFVSYVHGSDYPVMAGVDGWKYVRLIDHEPSIEITVKINGKECKLSDISEETLRKIREVTGNIHEK